MSGPEYPVTRRFAYQLKRADWVAIETLRAFSSGARRRADIGVLIASGVMGGLLVAVVDGPLLPAWLDARIVLVPLALALWGIGTLAIRGLTHLIARRRARHRPIGGNIEITLSNERIDFAEDGRQSTYRWPSLNEVVQTPSHVFLCMHDDRLMTFPLRLFNDRHGMTMFGLWAEAQMTEDDWDT